MGKDVHVAIVEIPTFTDYVYHLPKRMIDRRTPSEDQMAFIELNRDAFEFLDIEAYQLQGELHLATNGYVGAIPLRMPQAGKGKAITDLIVRPRYGAHETDWFAWMSEFATYADVKLAPEIGSTLELTRSEGTRIPRYLMAKTVIKTMVEVVKTRKWQRFTHQKKQLRRPVGNVDWTTYSKQSADPRSRLSFPTSINKMSHNHEEFTRAMSVLLKSITIINDRLTPNRIKQSCREDVAFLMRQLQLHRSINKEAELFTLRVQEGAAVGDLKRAMNAFIQQEVERNFSWRVDFSKLFERYVQKILAYTVKQAKNNIRIGHLLVPQYGHRVSQLMPRYLEPDMFVEFAGTKIVLDAKYKSYFYTRNGDGVRSQRDRIRSDIHQIIAYTSLTESQTAIIIAPVSGDQIIEEASQYDRITIGVLGIPLDYHHAKKFEDNIRNFLKRLTSIPTVTE